MTPVRNFSKSFFYKGYVADKLHSKAAKNRGKRIRNSEGLLHNLIGEDL